MKKIYFVTANEKKIEENTGCFDRFAERIRRNEGVELDFKICVIRKQLDELLDPNVAKIVKKKALEAYRLVLHPCVVEHGGLFLNAWKTSPKKPGLLGGIGQVVWDAVEQKMCGFLRANDTREAAAQSVIGYCDGQRIHVYSGRTRGELTDHARGKRGFRWDPIFKPAGSDLTYGEMTPEQKRKTSPEEKAWGRFFRSLTKEPRK